jgi:hypothetical protein
MLPLQVAPSGRETRVLKLRFDSSFKHSFYAPPIPGGAALGDERFKRQIAKMAGRRATPLPKGRPRYVSANLRGLECLRA